MNKKSVVERVVTTAATRTATNVLSRMLTRMLTPKAPPARSMPPAGPVMTNVPRPGRRPRKKMFYVAMASGFLYKLEKADRVPDGPHYKIVVDMREATPFATFKEADDRGTHAGRFMFEPHQRYYAIVTPVVAGV